ncbi:hypothetical protein COHA_009350 [Chlorella ohadii]|uniref:Uncharacterized protein n=1 Tax=Chlorella ohadii TaxID=2649997 RepID=A0AAD5DII8_9CHLO|nr:hypothetical protein COHA_009350 [Chlorella ohadii]
MPNVIQVQGLFGPTVYQRDDTDKGTSLRVPFCDATPAIREQLKALGFRCHHDERYWELGPRQFSAEKEQLLRTLLEVGELPAGSPRSPAVTPTKRRFGASGAAAVDAGSMQQPDRQQLAAGEEAVIELHEGTASHVTLRRSADGTVVLQGAGLWNIRPMLERILHFEEVPTSAGTAACVGVGAPLPRWRSTWPLSGAEQASGVASGSITAFVEAVLEHRKRSLRHASHDDREPIPPDVVVPPRFRPRGRDGLPMRGPFFAKRGPPHNIGRQFFSPAQREGGGPIMWANGSYPEEGEDPQQKRFNEWELRDLEDREDWEEDVPTESREGDWGEAGGEEGVDQEFFD